MGKTATAALVEDVNTNRAEGLLDPATGTFYFKRGLNLRANADGDYADQGMVVVGANANAALVDANGSLYSIPKASDGGNLFTPSSSAFSDSDGTGSITTTAVGTLPRRFNGSTWDRQHNNIASTLLASAARTTTTSSPTQTNREGRGVFLFLNVTAASGTGGLQVLVFGVDPVSGNGVLLSGAAMPAITGTGCVGVVVYPGAAEAAGVASAHVDKFIQSPLPRSWFAQVAHGDGSSYTYSLGCSQIL